MPVALTPEIEAMVEAKVASGDYPDAASVIAEALRLLDDRDREARFYAEIETGLEQVRRGETTPWSSETMGRIRQRAEIDEAMNKPIQDAVRP